MTRGSAVECAACLDALVAKKTHNARIAVSEGKAMLLRVVGMLTKLVDRFDVGPNDWHEDAEAYDSRPRPSLSSNNDRSRTKDEKRGGSNDASVVNASRDARIGSV